MPAVGLVLVAADGLRGRFEDRGASWAAVWLEVAAARLLLGSVPVLPVAALLRVGSVPVLPLWVPAVGSVPVLVQVGSVRRLYCHCCCPLGSVSGSLD